MSPLYVALCVKLSLAVPLDGDGPPEDVQRNCGNNQRNNVRNSVLLLGIVFPYVKNNKTGDEGNNQSDNGPEIEPGLVVLDSFHHVLIRHCFVMSLFWSQ